MKCVPVGRLLLVAVVAVVTSCGGSTSDQPTVVEATPDQPAVEAKPVALDNKIPRDFHGTWYLVAKCPPTTAALDESEPITIASSEIVFSNGPTLGSSFAITRVRSADAGFVVSGSVSSEGEDNPLEERISMVGGKLLVKGSDGEDAYMRCNAGK